MTRDLSIEGPTCWLLWTGCEHTPAGQWLGRPVCHSCLARIRTYRARCEATGKPAGVPPEVGTR